MMRKLQVIRMSNRRNFSNNTLMAKRIRICEHMGRAETDGIVHIVRPWGATQKSYQWTLLGLSGIRHGATRTPVSMAGTWAGYS